MTRLWRRGPRLAFLLLLTPFAAAAQPADRSIDERLEFLEEHLEADAQHARYWQWGWMGITTGGTIWSTLDATNEDGDERVDDIVDASKSVIGLMYLLLRPMESRLGALPVRSMPARTLAEKRNKLLVAEALLERNARRAKERTSWKAHLGNLAFNAVGFGFIAGFGDLGDAAISSSAGAAAGALQLWSQPGRAVAGRRAYEAFGNQTSATPDAGWRIAPTSGGIAFRYSF